VKVLAAGKDKTGEFYRASFYGLFQYVSNRIPEIADEVYRIDAAMSAGFGWELPPFETWDALGVAATVKAMEAAGSKPAQWVYDMLNSGAESFFKVSNGIKQYYDIPSKSYKEIPGTGSFIILDNVRANKTIWENKGASIIDIGDGIINLEFHSKMNTIGEEVVQGMNKAIDIAEKDFRGLVIGNDAANFSAGANLALILMLAIDQDYDEISLAVRAFQNMNMRVRYSSIPVVVAPHGLTLGGGCEMSLHADSVQAAAETYIGLVEVGVGLIPGGGGSKEFALRASDAFEEGEIELPILKERFLTIGMAKTAISAHEAYDLGILRKGIDRVSINNNRLIADAKERAIELADAGYVKPLPRKDIKVLGRAGLGMIYAGANTMLSGNYITEHDQKISQKLGWVLCGGDLSSPTLVSEQYLLDLEREAFLSLCGEKKTLDRIQYTLKTGKPLRN
jgi:3-hydroxyacyl-CoA dehydrogenase